MNINELSQMTPNFCSFKIQGENVLFLLDFHNTDEIVCYF